MRWIPWLLGLAGVAQFGVMAMLDPPADYVSLDTSYLVMFLCLIGAFLVCALSWCGGCCDWGDGCGCDCCGECAGDSCCGKCSCATETGSNGHQHSH